MAESLTPKVVEKCMSVVTEYLDSTYRDEATYKVQSFSIKSACEAGDNFLGAIYAVKFSIALQPYSSKDKKKDQGENGTTNGIKTRKTMLEFDLILKSQLLSNPSNSSSKYFWNIMFTKEKLVYTEIVQKLEEIGQIRLAPKLHHFFSEGEDYSCLILDNLITQQYYSPKSAKNLTLDEFTTVILNLARFHALSIVLEEKVKEPIPKKYDFCAAELMFSSLLEHVMRPLVQNGYLGVLRACEKIRPNLVARLKAVNDDETMWKRACEFVKAGNTSFSCICHGDARLANLFFKKSSEDEDCFRSIDFQLTRYASPVSDLVYAFYIGTTLEFRKRHLNTLLSIYYDEFTTVLSRYQQSTFTVQPQVGSWSLQKLKEEFDSFKYFGLIVGVVLLPVVLLTPGDFEGSSIADMTPEQREQFMITNRADLIANVLPKNEEMKERVLEVLDEILS